MSPTPDPSLRFTHDRRHFIPQDDNFHRPGHHCPGHDFFSSRAHAPVGNRCFPQRQEPLRGEIIDCAMTQDVAKYPDLI